MKAARRGARHSVLEAPNAFFADVSPVLKRPPPGIVSCAVCNIQQSAVWRKGPSGRHDLCNKFVNSVRLSSAILKPFWPGSTLR